jgi:broad specificity phosphatase PhoE
LIRHGQASFGAADYDHLSAMGKAQAEHLGRWFAHTGKRPDLIAVGTLRRHVHTADLCLQAAGIDAPRLQLPELDEVDHVEILRRYRPDLVSFEALREEMGRQPDPQRAFQEMFVAAIDRWTDGAQDGDYAVSWPVFRARVLQALKVLAEYRAQSIWAFTSGGPIAVIANALLRAPPGDTFALSWPLVNTSLTRIAAAGDGPRLVSYNAWPHLEAPEHKHLVTHR